MRIGMIGRQLMGSIFGNPETARQRHNGLEEYHNPFPTVIQDLPNYEEPKSSSAEVVVNPVPSQEKLDNIKYSNGQRIFTIEGVEIWALNQKNAERKYKQMQK